MRAQQIDLPLEASGLVLLKGKAIIGGPLQLGSQLLGGGDQGLHKILPVHRLEMPAIWNDHHDFN